MQDKDIGRRDLDEQGKSLISSQSGDSRELGKQPLAVPRQVNLQLEAVLLKETSLIFLDPTRCQGCRLCEAACSLHHTGHKEFNPALTSTRISRDNDSARITMSVDSTCDSCMGEKTPLCVKYCAYGARSIRV